MVVVVWCFSRSMPLVGNLLLVQPLQQQAAGLVVADDADRKNVDAQRSQVHHRIAAAAGNHGALAMLQDQHRRLARDARNLAKDEFVGHQVGQHGDRDVGERLDDLLPALRIFQVFDHELK